MRRELPSRSRPACHKLVESRYGQARFCKACADRRERASVDAARERHYGRVFTYAARSCADCPADLTGAPSARRRCDPCAKSHRLARRRRDETATAALTVLSFLRRPVELLQVRRSCAALSLAGYRAPPAPTRFSGNAGRCGPGRPPLASEGRGPWAAEARACHNGCP